MLIYISIQWHYIIWCLKHVENICCWQICQVLNGAQMSSCPSLKYMKIVLGP